jgi:uncharacterized protein
MYNVCILVAWDPDKARTNYRKHGVRFSDAETALFDPMAVTSEEAAVGGERRFVSIGADAVGRVLVVVYCYRGDDIRLISARRANRKERKQYEEGI